MSGLQNFRVRRVKNRRAAASWLIWGNLTAAMKTTRIGRDFLVKISLTSNAPLARCRSPPAAPTTRPLQLPDERFGGAAQSAAEPPGPPPNGEIPADPP